MSTVSIFRSSTPYRMAADMCPFLSLSVLMRVLSPLLACPPRDEPRAPTLPRSVRVEIYEICDRVPVSGARTQVPRSRLDRPPKRCNFRGFLSLRHPPLQPESPVASPDHYGQRVARDRRAALSPALPEPVPGWAQRPAPRPRPVRRFVRAFPAADSVWSGRRLLSRRISSWPRAAPPSDRSRKLPRLRISPGSSATCRSAPGRSPAPSRLSPPAPCAPLSGRCSPAPKTVT